MGSRSPSAHPSRAAPAIRRCSRRYSTMYSRCVRYERKQNKNGAAKRQRGGWMCAGSEEGQRHTVDHSLGFCEQQDGRLECIVYMNIYRYIPGTSNKLAVVSQAGLERENLKGVGGQRDEAEVCNKLRVTSGAAKKNLPSLARRTTRLFPTPPPPFSFSAFPCGHPSRGASPLPLPPPLPPPPPRPKFRDVLPKVQAQYRPSRRQAEIRSYANR